MTSEPCKHERALAAQPGWVQTLTKIEAERDTALATIGRVRALLGDTGGPLWSVRGVRESDLRTALEATS